MPVRKPVLNPPFNVVRASHVEFGVRDLARARAFYVDCLGYLVTAESADALYLRGRRGAQSPFDRAAPGERALRPCASASRWRARRISTAPPPGSRRKGLPTAFPEVPYPGPHAAHRRSARHAARLLCPHGPGRSHAAALRRLSGRAHPAHRPYQLLHARTCRPRYDFYTDLGFRLTEYTETDDPDAAAVGGVAAPQGQRARPRLHQRARARGCITSACGPRARSTSCTSAT